MSNSYQVPAYFHDFTCIGSECEDTCCRDWEVKLDRQHYESLSKAVETDLENKEKFIHYVHLNDNSISGDHDYAFIRMAENGYCAMLDKQGLCSIHKKYGVEILGNVCTMFPRIISRSLNAVELSGALSCPEVVRKCIRDDKPLKLKRFKPSELPRSKNYPIQRDLSFTEDPYSAGFNEVRKVMMKIMADENRDIETRLYVLANMAQNVSAFYHRGCQELKVEQLNETLKTLSSEDVISRFDTMIKNYEADTTIAMIVVHSVLSIKLQQAKNENISVLYQDILSTLHVDDEAIAEALMVKMQAAKNKFDTKTHVYIDRAMTRYIINCLYREWFVSMPDPFTYVQMLLVRIAILRALIYLHLDSVKEQLSQAELEKRIVFIMYNFARSVDQNLEFLKVVFNALSEQTMMTFDFSPVFIRIFGTGPGTSFDPGQVK